MAGGVGTCVLPIILSAVEISQEGIESSVQRGVLLVAVAKVPAKACRYYIGKGQCYVLHIMNEHFLSLENAEIMENYP